MEQNTDSNPWLGSSLPPRSASSSRSSLKSDRDSNHLPAACKSVYLRSMYYFPILKWAPDYDREKLINDLFAGLHVHIHGVNRHLFTLCILFLSRLDRWSPSDPSRHGLHVLSWIATHRRVVYCFLSCLVLCVVWYLTVSLSISCLEFLLFLPSCLSSVKSQSDLTLSAACSSVRFICSF